MPATIVIQSTQVSTESGSKTIGPLNITCANSIGAIQDLSFGSATFISVTPPPGSTSCTITPPVGNLVGLTLKGVTGDTGIPIQPNQPLVITFANTVTPANFGLTSAGAISGVVELSFC